MAQRSKSNYKSTNDLLITTNGVGDISGADVNAMLDDAADSFVLNNGTSTINKATWDGAYSAASGTENHITITPVYTQSSTAAYNIIKIDTTETSVGSGVQNFIKLQKASANKFLIDTDGEITVYGKIISASDGDIDIEPDGTGNVLLGNFSFDADQSVGAGQDNYVLTYDDGTGLISLEASAGGSGAFSADGDTQITPTTAIVLDQATGDEVALDLSMTVNKATSGNYTAIKVDVTETAAPGSSDLLLDLQVGSTSVFSIDNAGQLVLANGSSSLPSITFVGQTGLDTGFYSVADKSIGVTINAVNQWQFGANDIRSNTSGGPNIWKAHTSGPTYSFKGDTDSGFTWVSANSIGATTGGVSAWTIDSSQTTTIAATKGLVIPVSTDANRVATQGSIRYNTDGSNFEGYDGSVWQDLQGSGSSSGANNEVQTSDGSGGFVASNLFFDETTGDMTLGDSSLAGDRIIQSSSSDALSDLTLIHKGAGSSVIVNGSSTSHYLQVGQVTSGHFARLIVTGTHNSSALFTQVNNSGGTAGAYSNISSDSGDVYTSMSITAQDYSIGIDDSDSDKLKITSGTNPSAGTELLAFSSTGVGFFGTTPTTQSSAYTRNATAVEDRTLLASASATTTNNNNVLAALIADLQSIGILG